MLTEVSRQSSYAETRSGPAVPVFSRLEHLAIAIGIKDGRVARSRSRIPGLFILFASARPVSPANPRLEAMRSLPERSFRRRSVASVEEVGFGAAQIEEALALIRTEARPARIVAPSSEE